MDSGYRDDREGLRSQVRDLEAEVDELKRQLRLARDADVAAMRRELEQAEDKLASLQAADNRRGYFFAGLAAGLFFGIGVGMYLSGYWS